MDDKQNQSFNQSRGEQNFNIPPRGNYSAENFSPYRQNIAQNSPASQPQEVREVEPFLPPEYESSQTEPRLEQSQNFEDREIANWQAKDLIIGEKNHSWYIWFAVVVLLLGAFSIWVQNWTFLVLIIVSGLAILVLRSSNHARIISYSLSTRGVYIENSFYPYSDFKGFGVLRDGENYSIVLLPKKRFSPSTSIYFPKADGEKITDIIGQRLPMEEVKFDLIDRIVRKINL